MTALAAPLRFELTAMIMGLTILCAGSIAIIGSIGLGAWVLGL